MPPCLWAFEVENLPPRGVFFFFHFVFAFFLSFFILLLFYCDVPLLRTAELSRVVESLKSNRIVNARALLSR